MISSKLDAVFSLANPAQDAATASDTVADFTPTPTKKAYVSPAFEKLQIGQSTANNPGPGCDVNTCS